MASKRIRGITIEIDGNTTSLQKALKSVDSQLTTTQGNLKDLNRLLKLDPSNTTLLKQKQGELATAIDNTKQKLDMEKTALEQMKNNNSTGQVTEEQKALEREIASTTQELKYLEKQAKQSASVLGTQMQVAGDKIKEVGKGISDVGQGMTMKLTAPIVALGATAVKETASFDKSMSKVEAVSGATSEEMELLRAKAREMGAETKFSAQESADAFTYMAMAGWDAEQMMDGISGIMALSAADGLDLATTSDIVTDALTAFGLKAEDAGHFADVLASASSSANTNVSMLGESFKYVAPVAGSLGYSAEDTAVALGLMANAGIKGSQAGTTLRGVFSRMAKPTEEVQTAMDALGISLTDADGNMNSFMDIMKDLRTGFADLKEGDEFLELINNLNDDMASGNMTEEEFAQRLQEGASAMDDATLATKAQLAVMLAGQKGLSGLLAIVNATDDDFNSLAESIYGSSEAFDGMGTAQGMAEIMLDNLDGQITILKSQLGELAIQIGEMLMPYVQSFVTKLQDVVTWFTNLDEGTKKTIVTIAGIIAVVGPALLIIGKVVSAIGTIVEVGGMLLSAISAINPVVLAVVAVIGALVAIGVTLYKNWDKIKETASNLWKGITEAFDGIAKDVKQSWDNISKWTTETWGKIKTSVSTKFNEIKTNVTTSMNNIKTTMSTKMNEAKTNIDTTMNNIKTTMQTKFNEAKTNIGTTLNNLKTDVETKLNSAKESAGRIIDGIKKFFNMEDASWKIPDITTVMNGAKDIASGVIDGIKKMFNMSDGSWSIPSIQSVMDGAKTIVENTVKTIRGMFNIGGEWTLPKIKLPHFKVTGGFGWTWDGGITLPQISVEWYKKAYENALMFKHPTVLATANGLKGFGDGNGAEIVIGQNKLMNMIAQASGGGMTINMTVNGANGQNVNQLADIVIDKLTTQMKRRMR